MAKELGLGVIPWSPLASGVLTGKYTRADLPSDEASPQPGGTRKNVAVANGALTERGLRIAEVVKRVAEQMGKTPAQIAIAWTLLNPVVSSPIIGARTLEQLDENLGALNVTFSAEARAQLEAASAIELGFPHDFLNRPMTREVMFGGLLPARRSGS